MLMIFRNSNIFLLLTIGKLVGKVTNRDLCTLMIISLCYSYRRTDSDRYQTSDKEKNYFYILLYNLHAYL